MNSAEKKDTKQVIVVRKDLNMRKGKIASQVAHASLGIFTQNAEILTNNLTLTINEETKAWLKSSFAKIVVSCNSEQELIDIYNKARASNLLTCLITDSGKTEFNNVPTKTTCAIGPAFCEEIDKITGHLPLL